MCGKKVKGKQKWECGQAEMLCFPEFSRCVRKKKSLFPRWCNFVRTICFVFFCLSLSHWESLIYSLDHCALSFFVVESESEYLEKSFILEVFSGTQRCLRWVHICYGKKVERTPISFSFLFPLFLSLCWKLMILELKIHS